ncbi:hypothetical protein P5673_033688, partial [Acropora cervicornis]
VADCKLSFAELKQHASEINDLQVPKTEFVRKQDANPGRKQAVQAEDGSVTCKQSYKVHFLPALYLEFKVNLLNL